MLGEGGAACSCSHSRDTELAEDILDCSPGRPRRRQDDPTEVHSDVRKTPGGASKHGHLADSSPHALRPSVREQNQPDWTPKPRESSDGIEVGPSSQDS